MDWFLVISLVSFLLPAHGFSSKIFSELHKEPPVGPISKSARKVSEEWIDQWLDHTNPQCEKKWKMRYFANDEFYVEGGPIFIFVGGEWTASEGYVRGGHMYDMAKEFNGYMFYTEHRFYGKSKPTSNLTVENLKYLTSGQALADLAHFIQNKTIEVPGANESSVFLVGGSYSASLVTWFSHKYPTLVTGAWSSSAPLVAKLDFKEYFEVVAESIKLIGGDACFNKTTSAFAEMQDLINAGNLTYLSQTVKLCQNLTSDPLDIQNFFQTMSDILAVIVQSRGSPGIQNYCQIMNTNDEHLVGFAKTFKILNIGCLNGNFEEDNKNLKDTAWPKDDEQIMRRWIFQTCNEFAWFQTSDTPEHPFTNNFPAEFFVNLCQYAFGEEFSHEKIEHNICQINVKYEGLSPQVKNVYSTHGHLDPWKAAGAQTDINSDSPTVIIPGHSHCNDLKSIEATDAPELTEAREKIKELVEKWGNLH
uniref:Putative thymus-specific serine protease n=1 Tax=Nyssomyia neivai TaxID=330878 RepID=A0A1L8DP91_9DIPT